MLHLIKPNNYNLYRKDLDNMYRLRHRVFCTKLNWDVNGHDGMEKDQYDEKNAYYLSQPINSIINSNFIRAPIPIISEH